MNYNISIYRRLNPRLLVQVRVGLGLLHWANMSNISLTKLNRLLIKLLIVQFGEKSSAEIGSKQSFASTSKMIWSQLRDCANWIAHRIAEASACKGEQEMCSFVHTCKTSPLVLRAIAARAETLLEMAASVLIFIQPKVWGIHECWTGSCSSRVDSFVFHKRRVWTFWNGCEK